MDIVYTLVPITMMFVLVAVLIFLWAVKSEQFEDLNRQGTQILFEEDAPANLPEKNTPTIPPLSTKQQEPEQKSIQVIPPQQNLSDHDNL
ncbi:cbb3-type cytochrome oxidase assembly protein CcoS [Plesiomonas sp.]|uniref:cbb3-type cytochrome oxidase assembly protein CcoS n=1 Tax=Plesiomonas sp. TaxID=2486279 RepID=UPI003F2E47DB